MGYIEIMEKKMETTIWDLGIWGIWRSSYNVPKAMIGGLYTSLEIGDPNYPPNKVPQNLGTPKSQPKLWTGIPNFLT